MKAKPSAMPLEDMLKHASNARLVQLLEAILHRADITAQEAKRQTALLEGIQALLRADPKRKGP